MPLPLVPLAAGLGTVVGSVFAGLVGWLSAVFSRKVAVGAALAAFLVAGWVAIQASLAAAWIALGWAIPGDLVVPLSFVKYLLPSNTAICIQTVILAKIGRWLWDGQRDWARAVAAA